ncbi:hypothetical protein [Mobiluncus sp.]|uniref:hypothetical protein n=1 Tax=Mobiluncus sp. TaxID=47293 RepID=UPI002A91FB68|nr:hypothetical protein [Mobiluncus sp.]MDY5855267.1 hypothetical protein [Arcanobacterium sp.]MDY6076371.1 hypothetical protein [Mobiluncus sp.]
MRSGFWISSVGVYGHESKPDSAVSFEAGLNVLCGPSNSGKSWVLGCIDYMFGASQKSFVIDEKLGYTYVGMTLQTPRGKITLHRPIGEGQGTVDVTSTDSWIVSGDYKINPSAHALPLSYLWIRLLGFEHPEEVKVITSKEMTLKSLTWRTFWHALYADEDAITTKNSILMPEQATARTGFKSALATLVTGEDFAAYADRESPKAQKMRNNAVIDYLETLSPRFEERLKIIDAALGKSTDEDINNQVQALSNQAAQIQRAIQEWMVQSKEIIKALSDVRGQLSEMSSLESRYQELASSYQARIQRFDFVVDGHTVTDEYHVEAACPVCSQQLPAELKETYAEPDIRERESLEARLFDLRQTMAELDKERSALLEKEQQLSTESKRINAIINTDLQPQLNQLTKAINDLSALKGLRTEKEEVFKQQSDTEAEIVRRKGLTFPKSDFNPLEHLPKAFWGGMDTKLLDTLGACAFPRLHDAHFNKESFDAVVNGKAKAKEGQGYRSFVNTAVLLALRSYLGSDDAEYNPGLLVIDTPLLGLDDPQLDPDLREARETIPQALYDYLATEQEQGQVIVVDNTKFMPDISSIKERCHLIRFTKQANQGRYGFLLETTDEELTDPEADDANEK